MSKSLILISGCYGSGKSTLMNHWHALSNDTLSILDDHAPAAVRRQAAATGEYDIITIHASSIKEKDWYLTYLATHAPDLSVTLLVLLPALMLLSDQLRQRGDPHLIPKAQAWYGRYEKHLRERTLHPVRNAHIESERGLVDSSIIVSARGGLHPLRRTPNKEQIRQVRRRKRFSPSVYPSRWDREAGPAR